MAITPERLCKSCGGNRPLKMLPTTTAGMNDKKRPLIVFACEFCDGPVFENAVKVTQKRKEKPGQ